MTITASQRVLMLVVLGAGCSRSEPALEAQAEHETVVVEEGQRRRKSSVIRPSPEPVATDGLEGSKPHVRAMARARARKQAENEQALAEAHGQDIGDAPLEGGVESLDALAQRMLGAAQQGDAAGLRALTLELPQYRRLFPLMAESVSAFKLGPTFIWRDMSADSDEGVREAVAKLEGKHTTFVRTEVGSVIERGKLRIHNDVDVIVTDEGGQERRLDFIRHAVEHIPTHTFKVLRYR